MNQDLDIGVLLRYVLTSHELWGSSCEGILRFACYGLLLGALLSTWVFALCFLRGYLRFARFFNVNVRQLAVNDRQCFLCGLWRQCSLMVLPQLAVGMGVNAACFARCG